MIRQDNKDVALADGKPRASGDDPALVAGAWPGDL